jgi:hypothetical protein
MSDVRGTLAQSTELRAVTSSTACIDLSSTATSIHRTRHHIAMELNHLCVFFSPISMNA